MSQTPPTPSRQVIDVYVLSRRDIAAARTFFTTAVAAHGELNEVVTDLAAALANVIEELLPQALHNTDNKPTTGSRMIMAD